VPETTSAADKSGWLAVFATLCIWIGFILVSRVGGRGELTGWDVAALRFGTGGLIALFFLPRVTLPPLKIVLLFSFFGGIAYACLVYSAFRLAPAAHAAVLLPGALPFETALIAWLWLGQQPSGRQRLALGLVLAGIVLTAADTLAHGPQLTARQLIGDLLFLGGSSSWAVFTLLLRRHPLPPLTATVATAIGAATIYLPLWWLFLPSTLSVAPVGEIVMQALYQGVLVVFVAMLLYAQAVRHLGAQPVALVMAIAPGVAALAAVPLLDEPLSHLALAGLAAVTLGALLGARPTRTEPHSPDSSTPA
jgi:drug/metabolite transporter (DMT)-like permease